MELVFVKQLDHPRTFVNKSTIVKFDVVDRKLFVIGTCFEYSWTETFRTAVQDLRGSLEDSHIQLPSCTSSTTSPLLQPLLQNDGN